MQIFSPEMRRNPFPFYESLRQQAPLISDPQGMIWMVFDHETVKQILSDHERFGSNVAPPQSQLLDWLVYTDPPQHTRLRKFFSRALLPKSLTELELVIRRRAQDLINRNCERGDMDLVRSYSEPLPARVIAEIIGIPDRDQARYLAMNAVMQELSAALVTYQITPLQLRQYERIQKELSVYITGLIQSRQRQPQEDLLTRLVQLQEAHEGLSEREIIGFIQMFYSGATETTTNLISNAVLVLLEHPEQRAELQRQPELWPSAIEEVLRYRSPIQTLIRKTRQTVQLHGQQIPAEKYIFAVLGAANRDPAVFSEPQRFDIHRDPNPHLAFGHGPHYCMGMQLARLEARIAIPLLLQHLPDLHLASTEPWPPQKVQYMLGPRELPVRFTPGPVFK